MRLLALIFSSFLLFFSTVIPLPCGPESALAQGQSGIIPTDPSVNRINWAAAARGSIITGGTTNSGDWPLGRLIDERESGTTRYSTLNITTGQAHIINLGEVRTLHTMHLHLWDGDERFFRYQVQASLDGISYSMLVDRTTGEQRGVQRLEFPLVDARYLKITGTHSSLNSSFHLINEILAIGDASTSPEPTHEVTIDARLNGGSSYSNGSQVNLHAGIYEVEFLTGAVSAFANDSLNGGRTWEGHFSVSVPSVNKTYSFGFIQNRLSRFATPAVAEASIRNQAFTIYLPVEATIFFWYPDSTPADNRGSQIVRLRQLSGPNDSLLTRVRDSMTRSVLWQQAEVANWSNWVANSTARDCFGCHIQTQASVGLNESKFKVAGLPVSPVLEAEFVDAYQVWQAANGSVSNANTESSLWTWAVSSFRDQAFDTLTPDLLNGLNWLLSRQTAGGGWDASHTDGNGAKLYFDGNPSATHTTGNMQALRRMLDALADGGNFVAFGDVTILGNQITFQRNYGTRVDIQVAPVSNVTGLRITITDSFSTNGNFVLSEIQHYSGIDLRAIDSALTSYGAQVGFPVTEAFNGVINSGSDGWAIAPRSVRTDPAVALFVFDEATSFDRVRIHQVLENHQLKDLRLEYTTEPNPNLSSTFSPIVVNAIGRYEGAAGELAGRFRESLQRAAALYSASSWNHGRNTRTAAQTIIGLHAALPYLEGDAAQNAIAKIGVVDGWLRSRQRADGGWSDTADGSGNSRVFQSAQALRAMLLVSSGELDTPILSAADHLLREQDSDGAWTSAPLARRLAATTWVEIALPTLFDRLVESFQRSIIDDLVAVGQLNAVELSWSPIPEAVSYNIYRRLSNTEFRLIRSAHVTEVASYLDTGLANEATYYYMVRWVNNRGIESADSNEASGTPYGLLCGDDSPPRITSRALTGATIGALYRYQLEADDPDVGDLLTFALSAAPEGMVIDAQSGLVQWTPTLPQEGSHFVRIRVSDRIGRFATQGFRVTAAPIFINQRPRFISTPVTSAVVGYPYVYRARALDPNTSDILSYLLSSPPQGMAINETTGRVGWRPRADQLGSHPVTLNVSDLAGLSDSQPFSVAVNANQPPTIISEAPTRAQRRRIYVYSVIATDPENGVLRYSLEDSPSGMSINAQTGRIIWTPADDDVGEYNLQIRVTDNAGAFASQPLNLLVPANEAPVIGSHAPTRTGIDQLYSYQVSATDPEGGSLQYRLNEAPTGMTISAVGLVQWSPRSAGDYSVIAEVRDEAGLIDTQSYVLEVREGTFGGGDFGAPLVTIDSPSPGSEIGARTPLLASIVDVPPQAPFTWEFELRRAGETAGVVIGSGEGEIAAAQVAILDPTIFANDSYDVWVHIRKGSTTFSSFFPYTLNSKLKLGDFSTTVTDLAIPLSGVPVDISRSYSSLDLAPYEFGRGWRLRFPGRVVDSANESINQAFNGATRVFVTKPDGRRVGFTFAPYRIGFLVPFFAPYFRPDPGVRDSLDVGGTVLFNVGGQFFELFGEFNPARYYLSTPDRMRYTIDETTFDSPGGLRELRDANANTLSISPGSITHSSGLSLQIIRDGSGRITSITNPVGETTGYSYDSAGRLIAVESPDGAVTTYNYDAGHRLTEIIDSTGQRVLLNVYNAEGRLIEQRDALGNPILFSQDVDQRQESITNRRGVVSTYQYDENGNLLGFIDGNGGLTRYSYDANFNLTAQTNPLGQTTSYRYDSSGNRVEQLDALGRSTRFEYNSLGQITRTIASDGSSERIVYDAFGRRIAETSFSGATTRLEYDSRGNVLREIDPLLAETNYEYSATGELERRTDATGNRTEVARDSALRITGITRSSSGSGGATPGGTSRVEYDSQGRLTALIGPLGDRSEVNFNERGLRESATDGRGQTSRFSYDLAGRLIRTEYPDGSRELRSYDAEDNLLTATDRDGSVFRYTYDSLGRLLTVEEPGQGVESFEYDLAGRMVSQTDGAGNRTSSSYDAAGRRVRTTDPSGAISQFEHDSADRLVRQVDPEGRETRYEYDTNGRLVRTVYADGSTELFGYDAAGNYIRHTDQEGRVTTFAADDIGRVTEVTDALGQVTQYEYDAFGNILSLRDANANTTRYTFDSSGRELTRTLPTGGVRQRNWDNSSNLISERDATGRLVQHQYDSLNRLTRTLLPGGGAIAITYYPNGQEETITDSRGVTRYQYDAAGRISEITNPDGSFVRYQFDSRGNRSSISTSSGTLSYQYDANNRLRAVDIGGGQSVIYQYDRSGLTTSIQFPNGARTNYSYDQVSRVSRVSTLDSLGATVEELSYSRDRLGHVTGIASSAGISQQFILDSLYRLTEERRTSGSGLNETLQFSYDAVGNRLQESSPTGTRVFTYDANDRLLTAGDVSFTYDANGNVTSEVRPGLSLAYTFDHAQRLSRIEGGGQIVAYTHDFDGLRVGKDINGVVTRYLVDPVQAVPQLLESRLATGNLEARYMLGARIMAQEREGLRHFMHTDALGSVRMLSDSGGLISDQLTYAAFGEQLARSGSTPLDLQFAGEQLDEESDSYYLRTRHYRPDLGRFISADGFEDRPAREVREVNDYVYAANCPSTYTDPWGEAVLGEYLNLTRIRTAAAPALRCAGKELVKELVETGVYLFILADGTAYVGQSKNIPRRKRQHDRRVLKGKMAAIVEMVNVALPGSGKIEREGLEELIIRFLKLDGIKLSNKVDPLGGRPWLKVKCP